MTQNREWKELERKTYRDAQQDGVSELLIGIGMILVAGIVLTPSVLRIGFYIPILLFSWIGEAFKRRVTYPRIGYVKFHEEDPKKVVGGIFLVMFALLAVMAIVFTLFGDVRDFDLWLQWFPAFCGVLLVGLFLDLAGKSGSGRYYLFALLSVISGFGFALVHFEPLTTGMGLYFLSMGILLTITGFFMLLWFLRKYPSTDGSRSLEEGIDAT